jgi:mono/diheme cytochrome c family protein
MLLLLLSACSGLGSEPRIVATLPAASSTPVADRFPVAAPNIALGAQVFAARCVDCHGAGGAGDGMLVASGQVGNPGNFRLPDAAPSQRPSDWYATVANGRIENLMPPWHDALSDEERWAVSLYSYTLHYTPEQLARGREVFAATCAECHGMGGRGDGERAPEFGGSAPDLTNLETMMTLSDDNIYAIVSEGQGSDMHALANTLSEEDRRAVTAFTRTLSLANSDAIAVQAPPPPAETPDVAAGVLVEGTVQGRISNGTAGGSVPAGLVVDLFYYDETLRETSLQTTTDASGAFSFPAVPISDRFQYAAIVEYNGRSFFSPPVFGDPSVGSLTLDVTLYELTEDPAVLTVSGMVTQVTAIGEALEITQLLTIRNGSDRAYSTTQTLPDGRPISILLDLPPGAQVLGFPDGEGRFAVVPEQFAIADTAPVIPNREHIVAVVYIIPYVGSAIIEQPLNYAVSGPVRVLVRPPTVTLQSAQLPPTGLETVGESEWQGYGGALTFAAGDVLRYELSGAAAEVATRTGDAGVISGNNLLPLIVCGVIAEILLVIGLYIWWRRRRQARKAQAAAPASDQTLLDGLIRQIAELDAQHERGELDAESYNRQRAVLKQRLSELMGKS